MLVIGALLLISPVAQASASPATEIAAKPPQKLICKRRLKTGSRTNFQQICHSEDEWKMIRQEFRRVVEKGQQQRGLR